MTTADLHFFTTAIAVVMPSVSRLQTAKRQAASGRRDCGVLEFWRCDERIWGCYRRLSDLASKPFLVKPPQRMSLHENILYSVWLCCTSKHVLRVTVLDSYITYFKSI